MSGTKSRSVYRTALAHREFRLLLAGMAVSTAGDWLYNVALLVFVYDQTHSATWVAITTIVRLAPYVVLGPVGGAIADRYDRRTVMLVSDLWRAAVMLLLALVAVTLESPGLVVFLAFVTTVASAAYLPAVAAMTPTVVGERDLAAANCTRATVEMMSIVMGPVVGAVLLKVGSPAVGFAINGLTFLLSASFVIRLRPAPPPVASEEAEASLRERVANGLRALRQSPSASALIGVNCAASAIYGAETVLFVLVSERLLGTGSEGVGYLIAGLGLGGALAAPLAGRLADGRRASVVLAGSVAVTGVGLALMAVVHSPPLAVALAVFGGAGTVVNDVLVITLLQRAVTPDVVARVFGVADSLIVGAILMGSLVAPPLVNAFDLKTAIVVVGLGIPLLSAFAFPPLLRLDREADARRRELQPRVDLLAGLGVFDGVPRAALELLAAKLEEQSVERGQRVVRQGEAAEHFYVIASGEFDVISRGEAHGPVRMVNHLRPGNWFGEIGLLEHIPRTASVTATTEASIFRIDGDDFLQAVNEAPVLSRSLQEGVVAGLARTHPSLRSQLSAAAT